MVVPIADRLPELHPRVVISFNVGPDATVRKISS